MSQLFKNAYRGYLIDHHSPAPPTVSFENLDVNEYERFFKTAKINNLMLYTKDHWGYSYYDTKIGTKHDGLKIDFIKEISDVLKRNNIEFNAYYCIEYDTLAPRLHPEWSIKDKDNNPVTLKGRMAKWGMPCYETDYRGYVLGQLSEIVENYHPDSLFLDIFGKTLCYCDKCKQRFISKYGYPLPEVNVAINDEFATLNFGENGRDVNAFLEDCASDMLSDIIQTVKGIDPTIKVTINFAALYPKKIRDMLDYQFTEPWAGNWLSAAYSRDTAKGQYPQLGPGDVSEVYNYKDDSIYELAVAQIVSQGCRVFMYSGSQHVDGTLEHTEASKIGSAYSKVQHFEQYLGNREVIADIAIIQSDLSSTAKAGTDVVVNAIGRCKKSDSHRQAILGAMTVCDNSKFSFKILPEQEATAQELTKFKCVILAGTYHISDFLKNNLTKFCESGGKIIADGECGLYGINGDRQSNFTISSLLGIDFNGILDDYSVSEWGGYIDITSQNKIWKYTPNTFPPIGNVQYKVNINDKSSTALGHITNPVTSLTDTTWVNWWCPPPKTEHTPYPAVTKSSSSYYIAYDFFDGVNKGFNLAQGLFNGIVEDIINNPTIMLQTDTPNAVGYVAYTSKDNIVIHIISHLAEQINGNPPVISAGILRIKTNISNAELVYSEIAESTGNKLHLTRDGEYLMIKLPPFKIHQVIVLHE